jgi:NADH-quinone oxidoreductase subunit J
MHHALLRFRSKSELESVFFYIFAALSVVGAILVISHDNPVINALSLVLTLFSTAVLFIFLLAHFLAAIQVLVYAGAIMVLFIFTVMYLNLREESLSFDSFNKPMRLSILFVLLIVSGFIAGLGFKKGLMLNGAGVSLDDFGTVRGVGDLLFRNYLLPFELTSVLIVVAIIGVVVIAKRRLD